EVAEFAVDLAHALAAVEVVAVLRTIAVARGPADDLDDLGPFLAEQMIVAFAQRRHAGGGNRRAIRSHRRTSSARRALAEETADRVRSAVGGALRVHRFIDDGVLQHALDIVAGLGERYALDPVDPVDAAVARIA